MAVCMCMQLKKSPSTALYVEGHGCVCMQLKRKSQYSFVRRGAWLYVHAIKKKKKVKVQLCTLRGNGVYKVYTGMCKQERKGRNQVEVLRYGVLLKRLARAHPQRSLQMRGRYHLPICKECRRFASLVRRGATLSTHHVHGY